MKQETTFIPADFKNAYEYLAVVYRNKESVDWEYVSKYTKLYADLLLIGLMHKVAVENK